MLKVGTMDDPSIFKAKLAIFTRDKQPFHHLPEDLPTLTVAKPVTCVPRSLAETEEHQRPADAVYRLQIGQSGLADGAAGSEMVQQRPFTGATDTGYVVRYQIIRITEVRQRRQHLRPVS